MSHFSTLKMKVKNQKTIEKVADRMDWRTEHMDRYANPYGTGTVKDATVLKDKSGQVKAVIDSEGNMIVDPYYMGNDFQKFCQQYGKEEVLAGAAMEGGWMSNEWTDEKTGELVIEVMLP